MQVILSATASRAELVLYLLTKMNIHQKKTRHLKTEYFIYGMITAWAIAFLFLWLNGLITVH